MKPSQAYIVLLFHIVIFPGNVVTKRHGYVPGLNDGSYIEVGDINIGIMIDIHSYSAEGYCSNDLDPANVQTAEMGAFVTDIINKDETLLPNITLGFVILDTCKKDLTALARSIRFSPLVGIDGKRGVGQAVTGVVGPVSSRQAVMSSSFLGIFKIPVLGAYSTSDELSDKGRYPYFMRLVPPDAFQAIAILDVVEYFQWTYVSLLYTEGSYGENAAKQVERLVKRRGICLAVSKRLSLVDTDVDEMDSTIQSILQHPYAKVIIVVLESSHIVKLFSSDHFRRSDLVVLGTDSMKYVGVLPEAMLPACAGTLFIDFPTGKIPGFREHLKQLTWINSTNPWLAELWEYSHDCHWDDGQREDNLDSVSCQMYDTLVGAKEFVWTSRYKYADGLFVYAKALHSLISDNCPELFRQDTPRNFNDCITGELLLGYMKNVSFTGYTGHIEFDDVGDMRGRYLISQHRWNADRGLYKAYAGEWDASTNLLSMNDSVVNITEGGNRLAEGVESLCSRPCPVGHYYQRKAVQCCWECVACRDSEITTVNLTACQACPDFTWPDPDTRSQCEAIRAHYLHAYDPVGIGLLSLSAAGVVLATTLILVYLAKQKHRLLKATSRELSVFSIVGCALSCIIAMLYITYPDIKSCILRQTGFHMSVCVMYAPLLAKTSRVYRIFNSGKNGTSRPKFISNKAQLIFTSIMIVIEVGILEDNCPRIMLLEGITTLIGYFMCLVASSKAASFVRNYVKTFHYRCPYISN